MFPGPRFLHLLWIVPCAVFAACRPAPIALPRALTTDVVDQGFVVLGEARRIEIAPGDTHTYRVRLAADTFITLVAEQDNVDVHIRVRRPDRSPYGVFTTRERYFAPDVGYFIADQAGVWEFEIVVGPVGPRAGAYTLTLEALRPPTEDDRRLMAWQQDWAVRVGRLFNAANQGDWETVIPAFYEWLDETEKFPPRDPKHVDVAVGAITLAREQWNRFQADAVAVQMLEAAIAYSARVRGERDVLEAPIRAWLSGFYLIQDRFDDARREFEIAGEILSREPGVEPMDQAVVDRAAGRYYLDRGPPGEAVRALESAYALWSEVGANSPAMTEAAYDLGSAYLVNDDIERAREMLETATTEDALRTLPPYARADRLTRMARACLGAANYECVRSTVDRALEISDSVEISVNRVSTALELDATARIGVGDYRAAAASLERALENETRRPSDQANRLLPSHRILTTLADLETARGRWSEADRRYREAIAAARTIPGYRPFTTTRTWSRLLGDLGRVDEAERLELWPRGEGDPFPFPAPIDLPEGTRYGPSRNTVLIRTEEPFHRNVAPLWEDLGLPRWNIPNHDCRSCRWEVHEVDPDDAGAGVLMRVSLREADGSAGPTRLFLFRPFDRVDGVDRWEATDVRDFPMNPDGRFGIAHTGGRNVVQVSVDRGPGESDVVFEQFEIVDGRFVRVEE